MGTTNTNLLQLVIYKLLSLQNVSKIAYSSLKSSTVMTRRVAETPPALERSEIFEVNPLRIFVMLKPPQFRRDQKLR